MKKNQILALIIGILGLIVMFFFPETNFGYYAGFVVIVVLLIIIILKKKKLN